jgi:ribosomal protein S18 acetylase RimI-like enzyme
MEQFIGRMADGGFTAITLTVTESNREAVQLYESLGFNVKHRFHAMVKDNRFDD